MKKILLLLLFIVWTSNSQNISFTNSTLKNRLLQASSTNNIASTQTPNLNGTVTSYNKIDTNNDGDIQLAEASVIKYLNLHSSLMSPTNVLYNLNEIQYFSNLETLICYANSFISGLNLSNMTNLRYLNCQDSDMQFGVLNLSGCTNLQYLDCRSNGLSQGINVTGLTNLKTMYCGSNLSLNYIEFAWLTGLETLYCNNTAFVNLDLSPLLNLKNLYCQNNFYLSTLNIKCGNLNFDNLNFSGIPNLNYICSDEEDIDLVNQKITEYNYTNCFVNNYCTITPGGNFKTVTGNVRMDFNINGCDDSDSPRPNIKMTMTNNNQLEASFTNSSGNYTFFRQPGNYSLSPSIENLPFFIISPSFSDIIVEDGDTTIIQNFCVTADGIHNDIEVLIAPIGSARPGFNATYKIIYKNKGNQTQSGTIDFTFNDAVLDFVSATINPDAQNIGNLNWNYTNLLPFESRSFEIVLEVNAPTDIPPVNIGDVLDFMAIINPISGDELPLDNTFSFSQTVIGSYDPNNKVCLEGNVVPTSKIGDYLHYTINFENTGTAPATFVVVKDIIDTTKFDLSSLQIMNSSHAMETRITGNKVEYIFNNINLGPNEHGNVTFKIKTKTTLVEGNTVTNNANIYFDYNFPIETNTASTTFQTLSSDQFVLDNSVIIAPNPTKNNVNININNNVNIKTIELFDVQGRVLTMQIINNSQSVLDVSHYTNGIYFVKVTTEKGSKVEKIIKE